MPKAFYPKDTFLCVAASCLKINNWNDQEGIYFIHIFAILYALKIQRLRVYNCNCVCILLAPYIFKTNESFKLLSYEICNKFRDNNLNLLGHFGIGYCWDLLSSFPFFPWESVEIFLRSTVSVCCQPCINIAIKTGSLFLLSRMEAATNACYLQVLKNTAN